MPRVDMREAFFIMETIVAMAVISIISWIFSDYSTKRQQQKEFQQQQMLQEDQQQFTAEQADLAYERNKASSVFEDMTVNAGFNPNLAAAAIMGTGNNSPATAMSSPGAPTVNSAISALSSMMGQSGQNLYDMFKQHAEIQNLNADTNKKEVEAGLLPRDYQLRALSTEAQIKVWDKSVEKMSQDMKLTEQQTELVKQQNMFYGRKTEAEITALQEQANKAIADAALSYEKINTEKAQQVELGARAGLESAQIEVAHQQAELVDAQTEGQKVANDRQKIAKDFEVATGNIPLTVDGEKYVQNLISQGKFEEAKQFYNCVFASALNQAVGSSYAKDTYKIRIPFFEHTSPYLGGNPTGHFVAPIWNPQPTR